MKKYRLLKDTPCAKAGAICVIKNLEVDEYKKFMATEKGTTVMDYNDLEHICRCGTFGEWFKEVEEKPWEPGYEDEYYHLTSDGDVEFCDNMNDEIDKGRFQIGNYFETKEDTKKAIEKLKALKRLRNHGFKFAGWKWEFARRNQITITATITDTEDPEAGVETQVLDDLHLLFKEESDDERD